MEARYRQRLARYVTAMRNGKPDMVPIRPFVAEFTGKHSGHTCQELAHDYTRAFAAARRCAADYDWDAVVSNMVYVWTGLTQALGLKYYGIPGIDFDLEMGFQYREPPEDQAFMKADEYDRLIDDPTAFLLEVWLPRVSTEIGKPGAPNTRRHNLALLKGGMAMMRYFNAFGEQNQRLKDESGTVSAIAGIFKAPMDILADKLRGYLGLVDDLHERRDKVLAACEALAPHLLSVARATADPAKLVPIGYWMHRGGVPFVSPEVFRNVYWATVKPIIEDLWADGHQTLFYAEGNWDRHLESFAELPDTSIVYHVDRGDVARTHAILGDRFCISGGLSNTLLATGTPEQVRARCKEILDIAAKDGGYIMDASAIVQNDARVENLRAMTEATREFGVYSAGSLGDLPDIPGPNPDHPRLPRHPASQSGLPPGVCFPWDEKKPELPRVGGDPELLKNIWESIDSLPYAFIWQVLLSF
jgi:hypothetical protein